MELTGRNYNSLLLVAPVFMAAALVLMLEVKRGEAVSARAASVTAGD